jgi:hypothetical protein
MTLGATYPTLGAGLTFRAKLAAACTTSEKDEKGFKRGY